MAICYLSCNHIFSFLLSYNLKEAILESTIVSMVLKQGGLLPKNTSKELHQERHKAVTGSIQYLA